MPSPEAVWPVLIHIKSGDAHSFCIATIVRGPDGELYGDPFVKPQGETFARLGKIKLEARFLELLPDSGAGKPIHIYHGVVTIPT